MLRAWELALIDPLSLLIALPSEPLVQAPSVQGQRAWQPIPGIASRGLQSRGLQSRTPASLLQGVCEVLDGPPRSQESRGPSARVLFTRAQVYVCVCAPVRVCARVYRICICGPVHVCQFSGTRPVCVLVHVCLPVSFLHASTFWYYLCPCVYLCTCGCLVICA